MRNYFVSHICCCENLNSVGADSISARLMHKFIAQNACKIVGDGFPVPRRKAFMK